MHSPVLKSPKTLRKGSVPSPEERKSDNVSSPWDRLRKKFNPNNRKDGSSRELDSSSDHAVGYRRPSLGRSPRSGRSKSRGAPRRNSSQNVWVANIEPQRSSPHAGRKPLKTATVLALPAPGDEYKQPSAVSRSKSPRSRKLKDPRQTGEGESERNQERLRRKGSKKHGFLTPNPARSKPFVEVEDPARFTHDGDETSSRRSKSSSRRSSSVKKKRSDKTSDALVPFDLPFDDDATTSSRTSTKNSKRESKSPKRKPKRISKLEIKGYESEIQDLQNQVMELRREKYDDENDLFKQMNDFKKKAFDAKLELQRSQLENREVRSELRDKTTALKEAELDILDLEKRLREKANEIFLLEDELQSAQSRLGSNRKNGDDSNNDEVSIGAMDESSTVREKDAKIATLEKEIQRLKNSASSDNQGESTGEVDVDALRRALQASRSEAQAMKSKFEAAQERNMTLDDEVQHWKSQSLNMEDELAEVRTQLKYWMAKYEDVVGASDSAKSQLSAPPDRKSQFKHVHSLKDLAQLDAFQSEHGSYPLDGSPSRDQTSEGRIGGFWKKLTTPGGTQKPKVDGSNSGIKQLSSTLH
eukprot:scaffold1912_cov135-Cylindrotheca_fusiformis.AAC.18